MTPWIRTAFNCWNLRRSRGCVLVSRLAGLSMSVVVLRVPVELVLLAGAGLRRLGIRRRDLIDTGPGAYGDTCRWAEALHGARAEPAGLTWMARQDDSSRAYVFFGDRIGTDGFGVLPATVRLDSGIGFALVEQAASDAGIAVVR